MVDTLALGEGFQINIAPKPSSRFVIQATNGAPVTFGAFYDKNESRNFAADNVGVTPIVRAGSTTQTEFTFAVGFEAAPPPN